MKSLMCKLRHPFRTAGLVATLAFVMTSLGLTVPAQAAPVQPVASIASVQTALVTTPESAVMVPQAVRRAPTLHAKYAWAGTRSRWGQSCGFQMAPVNGTHWRVFEVRQDRWWWNSCRRTGCHYDVRDGHTRAVWVYYN